MMMSVTKDLEEFGYRELELVRELINAWLDNGLPDDFAEEGVYPMFNKNSGYVFLTNSENDVCMMNGDKLETFYTCGSCGHEGFKEDFDHNSNECCREYMGIEEC